MLDRCDVRSPFVVGGWSFGGLVAYEIALQLLARGKSTPLVVLIDSYVLSRSTARLPLTGKRELLSEHLICPVDQELPEAEVERLYAVLSTNLASARQYRPRKYAGAVLSLRASSPLGNPDVRWREVADQLTHETIEANHYSILRPPALESVARAVKHCARCEADFV
jgi:phthiocerol/phenolphthiocerol synthesis type-I polyketide synthase E